MIPSHLRRAAAVLLLLAAPAVFAAAQPRDHQDVERRINALLQQMTLQEKVGQLVQYNGDDP